MSRFLLIIFLIIFCIVGYFAYTVFSKRESDLIETTPSSTTQKDQPSASESTDSSNESQENIIENLLNDETTQENTSVENTETTTENTNIYINVTPPDCMRECEPYKYDEKELKYCQNVCGISEDVSTNDCDKLKDLEKDYCYKNQAVEKKDASICDNISDTAVKRTCKNRIQEEILENM